MKFVDCIKQIVKNEGAVKVAQRSFIGMLEDYQAFEFEDEATSFKLILKHWCENGKMEKISKISAKISQWKIEVSDIIHQTESEGFKEEVVSDLLHKLLLGMGIIDSKFDWNKEFLPKKPSSLSSISHPPKTRPITNSTPRASSLSTNRISSIPNGTIIKKNNKRIETRDLVSLIFVGLYILTVIGVIISCTVDNGTKMFEWIAGGLLVAVCICRFDVLLNKNQSKFWNWTYWICIAVGLIMGILLEAIGSSSSKTEKEEVSIINAWLDHNVDDTLVIHCVFTAENATGETLDVVCTFQETNGWGWKKMKELKDKNNEYCDYYGNVAVSYDSILVEGQKQKISCVLCLPYSELHIDPSVKFLGQEIHHSLNCLIRVVDTKDEPKTLDETNLHFAYWYGSSEDID